jgi:hypothetical protein
MKNILLCDIDHTIAHSAWRDNLIPPQIGAGPRKWDAYYLAGDDDLPSEQMRKLLCAINYDGHYRLHYLTARPIKWRRETHNWLIRHGFPDAEIIMRPEGNHEASPFCKFTLMKERWPDYKQRVACFIEDRADVVAVFKAAGIFCLQSHLEQAA